MGASFRQFRSLSPWAGLLLATCSLGAQTPSAPPAAQAPPESSTLRIRKLVRLVEVDVIAKDKDGNPVRDLEAKDFTLLDNGQKQKISGFSVERGSMGTATAPPASDAQSEPHPYPTFSNTHTANVAATVILFDLLNTAVDDQIYLKKELLQSLSHMTPETPIALLILGDDLTVASDFTTSSIALAKAAKNGSGARPEGFGPALSERATGNPMLDSLIFKVTSRVFRIEEKERLLRTLAALNIIGEQLGRMRGRKSLLWLTGGLDMTWESIEFQNAVDKLNDADIAVYTVDARGVLLDPGTSSENDYNDLLRPLRQQVEEVRGDILGVIAHSTGGVWYHNTNRLDGAINQAMEDSKLVYSLDYYPEHDDWRGNFHKLELRVSRPGVHLRYRSGYVAAPLSAPTAQDQQRMIAAIASSPLDFSGVRFQVEVMPSPQPQDPRLVVHIPAEELQWSAQDQRMNDSVQVWFIQRRASGEDLLTSTSKVDLHVALETYKAVTTQGVSLASDVKLQPAAAKLRVLVRDGNSGRVGTVDIPVNAIPPSTPTSAPSHP